ncbi:MAG: hypothetical protein IKK75_16480 [Clostridia bacterium]|nr:hypothetical protein [Clostridia bacterium]
MKTVSTSAKVLYTLAKIASVCCIVAFCIIAVASVLLFAFNDSSMIEFDGLDLGNVTFQLAEGSGQAIKSAFLCAILPAFVMLGFGYAALRVILRILAPMKDGQPFDTSVSVNLKKLCWLTVGGGFCSQMAGMAAGILLYKAYDFSSLFLSDKITGVTMNLEMDLTFVLVALIFYMLSCVFRYGEELQQQSDETL